MFEQIALAFALMLILQGLQLLVCTGWMRTVWEHMASQTDNSLRRIGLIISLVGFLTWCAVWS